MYAISTSLSKRSGGITVLPLLSLKARLGLSLRIPRMLLIEFIGVLKTGSSSVTGNLKCWCLNGALLAWKPSNGRGRRFPCSRYGEDNGGNLAICRPVKNEAIHRPAISFAKV
jgi:hypothetical protein